ncbi:MAG: substrate-binding periplasmic protein [Pseudomonadales bacterium]
MRHLLAACLLSTFTLQAHSDVTISPPPFAPFISQHPSPNCRGVIELLIDELGKESGVAFNLSHRPYARIIHQLTHGALDAALIFKNPALLQQQSAQPSLIYLGPISRSEVVIISHQELAKYSDIYQLDTVATIRKASFDERFDSDHKVQKAQVESYRQGLKMFRSGRADAVIGSRIGLLNAIDSMAMPRELLDYAYTLSAKEWGVHINRNSVSPTQLTQLETAIEALYHPQLVLKRYQRLQAQSPECF